MKGEKKSIKSLSLFNFPWLNVLHSQFIVAAEASLSKAERSWIIDFPQLSFLSWNLWKLRKHNNGLRQWEEKGKKKVERKIYTVTLSLSLESDAMNNMCCYQNNFPFVFHRVSRLYGTFHLNEAAVWMNSEGISMVIILILKGLLCMLILFGW